MRSSFLSLAAASVVTIAGTFFATTKVADACAGLIGSNGAVNLGRTTTLAAYSNGEEHYVTSFEFSGTGGGEFGTLIPLPGVPSNVEKGGSWTLQRLNLETSQAEFFAASRSLSDSAAGAPAEVLIEKRIDALDITVLKGGGPAVAEWAQEHGFRLSPDAPEVLDFYAERSPIFLAAVFDGDAANELGQDAGDGTPVHLTIPTDNPWVPLRILSLGKQASDIVQADVYLLTDERPRILPGARRGLEITHSAAATKLLLDDLRSDENSSWVPDKAWLTKLSINSRAGDMDYDLAIDNDGNDTPSRVAAGLESPADVASTLEAAGDGDGLGRNQVGIAAGVLVVVAVLFVAMRSLPSRKVSQ